MVCAELIHNPYLLTTDVLFNGRSPKINSAIERFDGQPLVEWAKEVPRIFHDEMNGYDFDLLFTGTDSDFEKVQDAFSARSISDKDVRLIHKAHLEDVDTKRKHTSQLLHWLDENRNHRFDYDAFVSNNTDTLDSSIPYIIIQDGPASIELPHVEVQTAKSVFTLGRMVLANTPILLTVSQSNRSAFRKGLMHILSRPDVQRRQLFFLIHPSIDQERAIRIISDLGVKNPQVVDAPNDAQIINYINDYPAVESIRGSIRVLRDALNGINDAFAKVNRFREATNAGVRGEIQSLESEIESLKSVRSYLQANETYLLRQKFSEPCELLESQILSWRSRKSTITGEDQIWQAAQDYSVSIRAWTEGFEAKAISIIGSESSNIEMSLAKLFASVEPTSSFSPSVAHPADPARIIPPNIAGHLNNQTETAFINARNDFFRLLGASGDLSREKTETKIASFDSWRKYASQQIMPLAYDYVEACERSLSSYYADLTTAYIKEIDLIIEQKHEAKARSSSRLSFAEQGLQEDKDWIASFEDQLTAIERG